MKGASTLHRLRVGSLTGKLEREVGLDRRAQIPTILKKKLPTTVCTLLTKQVTSCLPNLSLTPRFENRVEHHVLSGQRHIRFELSPPVAVEHLLGQQMLLGRSDRLVEAGSPLSRGIWRNNAHLWDVR
jgi:hypothetical protein